jgi:two-component system, NtrC family, response regulator PilR
MSKAHALVVDDETDIIELVRITLSRMGISCRGAGDIAEAKRLLATESFHLCLTDMRLPDGSGIDLVRHIADSHPELPVAMITAHGSMDTAVAAMKAGAFDFVPKPVDLHVLRQLVEAALRLRTSGEQGAEPPPTPEAGQLLGDSAQMRELRRLLAKLSRTQAPVFISGESGTGKELAARLIHELGPRARGDFVPVNCGAIPHDLVESEMFGHKKGSFTGAIGDKQGLFQAAEGGTLFLDEVADLPLSVQVKLLRAIQEKSVRPVGAPHEVPVDARIISASHKDLNALVSAGDFRRDLFYRINVIELRMPPLRERPEDIPLLADHILRRIAHNGGRRPRLAPGAVKALQRHSFPGNVRELENILERAVALSDGESISAEDLYLTQEDGPASMEPLPTSEQPLEDFLGEVEKQVILKALDETHWNRTAAARKLGMTLRSLRYRLDKLGIE